MKFARFMSETLKEYHNEFILVYFDDYIIIFSETIEKHREHIRRVLQKSKINLNIAKGSSMCKRKD